MICERCGAQFQKCDTGYVCPECGIRIVDRIATNEDLKSYGAMTVGGIVLAVVCRWATSAGYVLTVLSVQLDFALPLLTFVFAGVALLSAVGLAMTLSDARNSNNTTTDQGE